VTDFLDEKHREITDRLAELKPLVEEYQRLEAAVAALDGLGRSAPAAAPAAAAPKATRKAARKVPGRRGPGRPRGSKTKTKKAAAATPAVAAAPAGRAGTKRKAGRRKGSGTRAAQALSFVQAQAGITIPELAAKMGIKQNYLYRVLPTLEEEGKVSKQGRGWHPKG
jgi:ribosomal protein S25